MTVEFLSVALSLLRTAVYFATLGALGLVSWRAVRRALPSARPSLKLAATGMMYCAVNTVVVEFLGLAGWLWIWPYVTVCALLGLGAWLAPGGRHDAVAACRLLHYQPKAWSRPFPGSPLAALLVFVLGCGALLVEGIDTQTLHGPWIVDMLQRGHLLLSTEFNYPMLMEYQYVPLFMIVGGDQLAILPRWLTVLTALLLIHAAGRQLGIPGRSAQMVAWWCVLSPMIWKGDTIKADLLFGIGILGALLASARAWQRHPGAVFLSLLSGFMMVGVKATGFIYAGLLCGATLLIDLWRAEGGWGARRRRALTVWPAIALLALPASIQFATLLRTGSPVFPLGVRIAGFEIFPGKDLTGTSILEHAGDAETWRLFFEGAMRAVGPQFPVLLILLVIAGAASAFSVLRGSPSSRRKYLMFLLACAATAALWLLFFRTPWSRGTSPDHHGYLYGGQSLRYAMGALFATYLLAVAFVRRLLPARFFTWLTSLGIPLILAFQWSDRRPRFRALRPEMLEGTILLTVAVLLLFWLIAGPLPGALRKVRPALAIVMALVFFGLLFRQVDLFRQYPWRQPCGHVADAIDQMVPPGSKIALSRHRSHFKYVLYGQELRNRLRPWPGRQPFMSWLQKREFDFAFIKPHRSGRDRDSRRLAKLREAGWHQIGKCDKDFSGVLLRRRKVGRVIHGQQMPEELMELELIRHGSPSS